MNLGRRLTILGSVACLLAGAAGIVTSSSLAAKKVTKCPTGGTPAPGSTVSGTLEVDGQCFVDGVTVNGSAVVDPAGWLFASKITVTNGISVGPGGELDLDLGSLVPGPVQPGSGSTVGGNITLDHPGDYDVEGARISGTVSVVAPARHPTFCGNVARAFSLSEYSTFPGTGDLVIGDPGPLGCTGNTIGRLSIVNSSSVEVEGNTVGLATLSASALELNGNTLGHLGCANGATILAPDSAEDTAGNTLLTPSNC